MRGNSFLGVIKALVEAEAFDIKFDQVLTNACADGIVRGYYEFATASGMSHEEIVHHLAHISAEIAWPTCSKWLRNGADPEKAKKDLHETVIMEYATQILEQEKPKSEATE